MMVWGLVYGSYIHTGGKSGGELLTFFDSYSYDGVSAGIWVIHTYRWQIWGWAVDTFRQLLLWWCECWNMGRIYILVANLGVSCWHFLTVIAPKASAEGACILSKLGDSYEVWLVTVVVVCVVTVMVWVLVYGSYIEVANMGVSGDTFWHIL